MSHVMKFKCKYIIIALFSFLDNEFAIAQDENEIQELVNKLSWESITMDHQYHSFILNYQDSLVQKLINIGKPATESLVNALKKPEKTVISHIILTNIWEPKIKNDHLSIKYIYKNCDDLVGWHYIFNGLVWEWENSDSIKESEIIKVGTYWNNRVADKKSTRFDTDVIFKQLEEADNTLYL